MALKIVDGSECKAEQLVAVVYGFPNAGKTTLALTCKNPILLDFDGGVHRAGNKKGKPIVRVKTWADVEGITMDDLEPYDTVIMDTVGTCLDYLSMDISRKNTKHGRGLNLNLQGYGELKNRFSGFLGSLIMAKKDVVLIAHVKEEQKGDRVVDRIIAPGSSKDAVYQCADIMGKLMISDDKKRYIDFDPSAQAYGKNVGLPLIALPPPGEGDDNAMEKIIFKAKLLINDVIDEGKIEEKRVSDLIKWINDLNGGPDVFNDAIVMLENADARPSDKKAFIDQAKKNGLEFDREEKRFFIPAESE